MVSRHPLRSVRHSILRPGIDKVQRARALIQPQKCPDSRKFPVFSLFNRMLGQQRKTALAMVFKLLLSARRKWRRLDGSNHLTEVVQGVKFNDGIKRIQNAA